MLTGQDFSAKKQDVFSSQKGKKRDTTTKLNFLKRVGQMTIWISKVVVK